MANVDAAFGFKPYGNVLRVQLYGFATSYGTAVYHGDLVTIDSAGYTTMYGGQVAGVAKAEDGAMIGAVVGLMDYKMDPIMYLPATTVGGGSGDVAGFALVADHPDQIFVAQEDGHSDPLDLADIGLNCQTVGTGGNTGTGVSTQEIDSSEHATTTTHALKIMNIYEDDTPSSAYARWIVKINNHCLGNLHTGA